MSKTPAFEIDLEQAQDPLVIALDVGSTASRGAVYDAAGRPAGHRHKVEHAFTTAADGTCVIDADQVVAEIGQILDALTDQLGKRRVAGVALDTFASSLVGVDRQGAAVTPCFTYADARCAPQVKALRAELDEAAVQQRTGTRLHGSYLAPRLRWFAAQDPHANAHMARWMSLGEYVLQRLIGAADPGTSTASWTGLLDRRTGAWDARMLQVAGVRAEQLGRPRDPEDTIEPTSDVGSRWKALRDARWFAPVTDGFASNLGTGGSDATTAVISMATSGAMRLLVEGVPETLPAGLWNYRVDARRSLLGGAVNDVGRAVTWAQQTLRLPEDQAELDAVLRRPVDRSVPLVLPFLTGERSTGWAEGARATLTGVAVSHGPQEVFRGVAEGVALTYRRVADALHEAAGAPEQVLASGRVGQDLPGLHGLIAQALGLPVTPVTIKRATLHGTAVLALDVLAPQVPRARPTTGQTVAADPAAVHYFDGRLVELERLYDALV